MLLRYVMVTSGAQNLTEKAEKFLKSVSILSVLTDEQRASLAHSLEDLKFEDGEYIVSKGDIADGACHLHDVVAMIMILSRLPIFCFALLPNVCLRALSMPVAEHS